MPAELITYGSDRRMELGAAECVRRMVWEDDWTRLRIGVQGTFDDPTASLGGTPELSIGVCSGFSNVLSADSATHVLGMRHTVSTWTFVSGPPAYFTLSNTFQAFKKIGTTRTTATFGSSNFAFPCASTVRGGLFFEIAKGSPNFTLYRVVPGSSAGQDNVSDEAFQHSMETEAPLSSQVSSVIGGGAYAAASITFAVDEADGVLDHVFVYWSRSTPKFSFNIKLRKVA